MLEGMSQALKALHQQYDRLDVMADNVANQSLPGYQATGSGVRDGEFATWLRNLQGTVRPTERPLDVALPRDSYFEVRTASGNAYTRRGDLRLDDQGLLVTGAGDAVLDESHQPITASRGQDLRVGQQGEILSGSQTLAKLGRYRLNLPPAVGTSQAGGALIPADPQTAEADKRPVLPGQLEESNVDPCAEQASHVDIQTRSAIISQAISVSDKTLEESLRSLGSSR